MILLESSQSCRLVLVRILVDVKENSATTLIPLLVIH